MRVLVTGANGFVGRILCPFLVERGHEVTRVLRSTTDENQFAITGKVLNVESIDSGTDWSGLLSNIDVVVHLAAKVHVMNAGSESTLAQYREVNVEGSGRLAMAAAEAGVRRLVYLSSIKVNGEATFDQPFHSADQITSPADSYGISKAEAEARLRQLEKDKGIEVVIIRPPLIYGPDVKGNLRLLSKAIKRRFPLPFGAVNNRRDLVSVYNLCDLISVCVECERAAGQTFLVSDGEPLSTAGLIRYMANAQSITPRLPKVPINLLKIIGVIFGRAAQVQRLTGNLEVDINHTYEVLGWSPPYSVAESFSKMYFEN